MFVQYSLEIDNLTIPKCYTEELEAVKEQAGATGKPPAAPPPMEPPPPDLDEPEDVYDIPSEAIDQVGGGGVGKPPALPPASPPPPIDEDIYDMGEDEDESYPTPAPVPIQPPRPPKSSPFNDHRGVHPFSSTFQPPQLRPPIAGPKAPAAPPPNSPPAVMVS